MIAPVLLAAALAAAPDGVASVDGTPGRMIVVGSYPRARSCLWSPAAGPYAAKTSLDLAAPTLSLEDALGLERLAGAGVRVRVVLRPPANDARVAAEAARLARAGAEVFRAPSDAELPAFAVIDGERVILPSPFVEAGASHALTAAVTHADVARAFDARFEALAAGALRVEPGAAGRQPDPAALWKGVDADEGRRTMCGTQGSTGRAGDPTRVAAVFGLDEAVAAVERATSAAGDASASESGAILVVYLGADGFRTGDAREPLVKVLDPVVRGFAARLPRLLAVVDPSLDRGAVETWVRATFPAARATLVGESIPVQSGFALRPDPRSGGGIAFVGGFAGGVVLEGQVPMSERELDTGKGAGSPAELSR